MSGAGDGRRGAGCRATPASDPVGASQRERRRRSISATLVAAPARGAGSRAITPMWLYNGVFPDRWSNCARASASRIRLDNRLAQDTTVHWHGLLVPPDQDGNPMDPVRPGASGSTSSMSAGTAGTYWYHPHAHQTVAEQVARGLAAPLIVRAADDPLADMPEVTMFVSGLRLDSQRADFSPRPDGLDARAPGRNAARQRRAASGPHGPARHDPALADSQRDERPLFAHRARRARAYPGRHRGGLLAAPIAGLAEILVAPAQRVEVLVTVERDAERALPPARPALQAECMGLGTYRDEDLLTLATSAEPPAVPASSRRHCARSRTSALPAAAAHRIERAHGDGNDGRRHVRLPDQWPLVRHGPHRSDAVRGGEFWDIVNSTAMDHPIHIHGTQFQLVSREAAGA